MCGIHMVPTAFCFHWFPPPNRDKHPSFWVTFRREAPGNSRGHFPSDWAHKPLWKLCWHNFVPQRVLLGRCQNHVNEHVGNIVRGKHSSPGDVTDINTNCSMWHKCPNVPRFLGLPKCTTYLRALRRLKWFGHLKSKFSPFQWSDQPFSHVNLVKIKKWNRDQSVIHMCNMCQLGIWYHISHVLSSLLE